MASTVMCILSPFSLLFLSRYDPAWVQSTQQFLLGQLGELASAVPVGRIVGWLPCPFHVVLRVFSGVVGGNLNCPLIFFLTVSSLVSVWPRVTRYRRNKIAPDLVIFLVIYVRAKVATKSIKEKRRKDLYIGNKKKKRCRRYLMCKLVRHGERAV